METQYLGLLIFLFVVAIIAAYYLGANRKKAEKKEVKISPVPLNDNPDHGPVVYKYMGEVSPNRSTKKSAAGNCLNTRPYFTNTALARGVLVFASYPNELLKGNNKWICLTDEDNHSAAVKINDSGRVLDYQRQ